MDNWKERCESAEDEVARLLKVRGAGCQCGDTDACRFLRERDEAQAEVARLRQELAVCRDALAVAAQYVGKALADGAYGNSVIASRALDKINAAMGDS